jgi:hypothetical protein
MTAYPRRRHEERDSVAEEARARALQVLIRHTGVIGTLTDEALRDAGNQPEGSPQEAGCYRR